MNHERLCAWSGAVFVFLFLTGWCLLARHFPPPSPMLSAEELAAFYAGSTGVIRAGLCVAMFSCIFWVPFVAVVAEQMNRIPGVAHVLVRTYSLAGALGYVIFIVAILFWMTASFRPERDPNLILLLSDYGWLFFTMTFPSFVCQNLALSLAVLADRSAAPIFPRWFAYYTIWTSVSFLPAVLIVFLKHGPFAWTGLIGLWIPLTLFTAWFFIVLSFVLKAIAAQEARGGAAV